MSRSQPFVMALGIAIAVLGLVIAACTFATAGDLADLQAVAARYGDDVTGFLLASGGASILVLLNGVTIAALAAPRSRVR